MQATALIQHYNRLNGNSITRKKLKEFLADIQRYLDSVGSGPFVSDLRGIATRIAKELRKDWDVIERLELVPIDVSKKQLPVASYKAAAAAEKASEFILDRAKAKVAPKKKEKRESFKPKARGKANPKRSLTDIIHDLWHISRTALAAQSTVPSRYDRMIYVKKELHRTYPKLIEGLSPKKLWLTIEDVTMPTHALAGKQKNKVAKKPTSKRESKSPRPPVERQESNKVAAVSSTKSKSLNGIVDASALAGVQFKTLQLTGEWEKEFHKLNSDTQMMFWGKPGSGKTVKLLRFAQYLASELNLPTLYIANEEFGRSTLAEKIKDFNIGHSNLKFAKNLDESVIDSFDVIFFDSINSIGMTLDDYKAFRERHPGKMYVLIVQSTKDGDFRGGKDWEHEVDIAGEVVNRKLILRKNRGDKDNAQKMEALQTQDAITEAKKKKEIRDAVKAETNTKGPLPNTEPVMKAA